MPLQKVAVIGFDNMEMGPPVVAALASHFGERPLHIRWHARPGEVSQILESLAMLFWRYQGIGASFEVFEELSECLECADALVLSQSVEPSLPLSIEVQMLPRLTVPLEGWPERLDEGRVQSQSFEVLRLLNREEYPDDFLRKHRENRLADWLEELDRA